MKTEKRERTRRNPRAELERRLVACAKKMAAASTVEECRLVGNAYHALVHDAMLQYYRLGLKDAAEDAANISGV